MTRYKLTCPIRPLLVENKRAGLFLGQDSPALMALFRKDPGFFGLKLRFIARERRDGHWDWQASRQISAHAQDVRTGRIPHLSQARQNGTEVGAAILEITQGSIDGYLVALDALLTARPAYHEDMAADEAEIHCIATRAGFLLQSKAHFQGISHHICRMPGPEDGGPAPQNWVRGCDQERLLALVAAPIEPGKSAHEALQIQRTRSEVLQQFLDLDSSLMSNSGTTIRLEACLPRPTSSSQKETSP